MSPRDPMIMCALSGLVPSDAELDAVEDEDDEDEMAGVPANWTRITVTRRTVNPEWLELQAAKREAIRQSLLQLPKADRAVMRSAVQFQVRALYAALEDRVPHLLLDEEVIYLAPPERSPDLAAAIGDLFQTLGVTALPLAATEAPEDEEDESEEVETGGSPEAPEVPAAPPEPPPETPTSP